MTGAGDEPIEPGTPPPPPTLDVAPADGAEPTRPGWAPLTLLAFVALVVLSNIGTAFSTKWANTDPARLLACSARVRHLVLVAGQMPAWEYAVIATARLALAYAVCHLIGRAYGRTVLVWFGRFLGSSPQQITKILQMFHSAEWLVVPFFVGSNIIAAITGISRTSLRRLVPLVAIGIAARLALWWMVAKLAEEQVDAVLRFLDRYQRPALIVSIVLTVAAVGWNLRKGRDFELGS